MKKSLLLALPALLAVTSLTGCGKTDSNDVKGEIIEDFDPVLEYEGDLDVFMYIYGQDGTWKDAGNKKWEASDIIDGSQALFFAAAREFKKMYPKIKINVISGNGTGYSPSYYDNFMSYRNSHNGKPPHIIHHVDPVSKLLSEGILGDYSKYKDKFPLYSHINPDLMKYYNFGGFQAAVPFGVFPIGVIVNEQVIQNKYITLPEPTAETWTLEALDNIISAIPTNTNGAAGTINLHYEMANFMASSIYRNYVNGEPVDFSTTEVETLLEYEHKWAKDYVWFDQDSKKHPLNTDVWNSWEKNELMASDAAAVQLDRSFSIGSLSQKAVANGTNEHFDFYPYPSIDGENMTLGTMFGALGIGDQCPINTNRVEQCTKKEKLAQEAAAYFATFMVSDPRSIKAQSEIEFRAGTESNEVLKGATKGFPVLRAYDEDGETYALPSSAEGVESEYNTQFNYFYETFPTWTEEKPGFAKVVEMYKEGDFIVCSESTYPMLIPNEIGGTENIFAVWNDRYKASTETGNVTVADITWVDNVKSRLSDWATNINTSIETAWSYLDETMHEFYNLPEDWDVREKLI